MKISYVDHMGSDLTVVNAARVSFNSSSYVLTDRDEKLISYLAKHEHMSPFEHCQMTFLVECPLYIRSQIHRHRTFAFNEISRRYTSEDLEFYVPSIDNLRKQSKSNRQASEGTLTEAESEEILAKVIYAHEYSERLYHDLLSYGVCREQARGVLPQNLMTKFYMSGNLRNIAHFVKLRIHEGAQQEVRELANQMLEIVEVHFPISIKALFE